VDETLRQLVCRHPFGNRSTLHHCGAAALRIGQLNQPSQDSSAIPTPPYDGLAFVVDPKTFFSIHDECQHNRRKIQSDTMQKKYCKSVWHGHPVRVFCLQKTNTGETPVPQ
jgi:hypothetical protein